MIFFESPRLKIRYWEDSDLDELVLLNSDKDVMKYFPSTLSKDDTEKYFGLLPTCTCGGNNEIEWVQQCFSNRTGLFKIYSKFEEKQMYQVFLNKFEYF